MFRGWSIVSYHSIWNVWNNSIVSIRSCYGLCWYLFGVKCFGNSDFGTVHMHTQIDHTASWRTRNSVKLVKGPFIFAGINIILLFSINGISGTCDGIYVVMAELRSNWIVLDDGSVSFEGWWFAHHLKCCFHTWTFLFSSLLLSPVFSLWNPNNFT